MTDSQTFRFPGRVTSDALQRIANSRLCAQCHQMRVQHLSLPLQD